MTAMEFESDKIEIGEAASGWGPFGFNLEPGIPDGLTVSSIVAKTYLGRVQKGDKLSDETETTSELVDSAQTTVVSSYIGNVYFNLPTTEAWLGVDHTVVITMSLSNTAVHTAYFYRIKVVREA